MSAGRAWRIAAAAAALTPALHALSFAPFREHFLAWIAFVPWFVAVRLASLRAALAVSALVTLAGSYAMAAWLPRAVATYYGQPAWIGALLFVGVWVVTVAPWVLAFTGGYRALARRPVWAVPLLGGAAWAAAELARVRLFVGEPFGLLGYSQVEVATLRQLADVTGVYGTSFLVAAVNVACAELVVGALAGRPLRPHFAALAVTLAVVALGAVYGAARLAMFPAVGAGDGARVAVVQADLDLGTQWRQEFYGRNLEEHMQLTGRALADAHPALVVWPEGALTFFLEEEPLYRRALATLFSPYGAELLTGGPAASEPGGTRFYNAAYLLSPAGEILARYDKERLLPFAEYFPFGIGLLRRQFGRVREFTPGQRTPPLPSAAGAAGILVCNEVMFPELAASRVRAGAGYLVNLANDSWLGDPAYAAQIFDMARVRAVEQRRDLVRASTSGPSAIVDAAGRVQVRSSIGRRDTVTGVVRARGGLTFYARRGDAFAFACSLAALAAAFSGRGARRTLDRISRRRRPADRDRRRNDVERRAS